VTQTQVFFSFHGGIICVLLVTREQRVGGVA